MASAKAHAVVLPEPVATERSARNLLSDLVLLALPAALFKQLSDAAMARNMTLPQLLSTAVVDYLKKTEK